MLEHRSRVPLKRGGTPNAPRHLRPQRVGDVRAAQGCIYCTHAELTCTDRLLQRRRLNLGTLLSSQDTSAHFDPFSRGSPDAGTAGGSLPRRSYASLH